jgi:hypothetical protein
MISTVAAVMFDVGFALRRLTTSAVLRRSDLVAAMRTSNRARDGRLGCVRGLGRLDLERIV